jgi:hypothetical protein
MLFNKIDWVDYRYSNIIFGEQGGCTCFPECKNLQVHPKRGREVIWSNVTTDGLPEPRAIHEGEAVNSDSKVTAFAKYGLNTWICEE